jgi:hypothetical protein
MSLIHTFSDIKAFMFIIAVLSRICIKWFYTNTVLSMDVVAYGEV